VKTNRLRVGKLLRQHWARWKRGLPHRRVAIKPASASLQRIAKGDAAAEYQVELG